MNEEMLDHPTSNLEFWFFPKFVILCITYKIKSWVIPIKLLFFLILMKLKMLVKDSSIYELGKYDLNVLIKQSFGTNKNRQQDNLFGMEGV